MKKQVLKGYVGFEKDLGIFPSTFAMTKAECMQKIGNHDRQGVKAVAAELRIMKHRADR